MRKNSKLDNNHFQQSKIIMKVTIQLFHKMIFFYFCIYFKYQIGQYHQPHSSSPQNRLQTYAGNTHIHHDCV